MVHFKIRADDVEKMHGALKVRGVSPAGRRGKAKTAIGDKGRGSGRGAEVVGNSGRAETKPSTPEWVESGEAEVEGSRGPAAGIGVVFIKTTIHGYLQVGKRKSVVSVVSYNVKAGVNRNRGG